MRVLVVATLDTFALCRLPRLFHDAGYQVDLMGPSDLTAMRSRYVSVHLSPEALGTRPEYARIVLADEGAAQPFLKRPDQFLLEALDAGIRMPACEICDYSETALAAAQAMGFPVLLQPGGYAANENELAALEFDAPVVVQSARGDRGSIAVLYDRGVARCWFAYLAFEEAEIEIFEHANLAGLIEKAGRMENFSGLASIDFLRDRERDEVLLSAFHPWPDRYVHLGREAGVDFVSALRHWDEEGAPQFPLGAGGRVLTVSWLIQATWSDPGLLLGEIVNYRRLRASSSSRVRGQSDPRRRESPRSASTFPPV